MRLIYKTVAALAQTGVGSGVSLFSNRFANLAMDQAMGRVVDIVSYISLATP